MAALRRTASLAAVLLSFAAIAGCSTSPGDGSGTTDAATDSDATGAPDTAGDVDAAVVDATAAVDAGPDADAAPDVEASSDGPVEAGCSSFSCGLGFVCVNGGCEGMRHLCMHK